MYRYLFFIAVSIALMACGKNKQSSDSSSMRSAIVVDCQVVKPMAIEVSETFAGVLLPNEEVTLRPEASGRVVFIGFAEGEDVAKGQLLLKVNDDDFKAQLSKTNQQLALAKVDEERKRELFSLNGLSREEYDRASTLVKTLTAEIEYINASIAKTEVRAPFNGKVGLRKVSMGAFVNNATEISMLKQINPLKLEYAIPEKMATLVTKGATVRFSSAAGGDLQNATIYAFEPGIDMATRTLKVRAWVDNSAGRHLPGSFATVYSTSNGNELQLVLPAKVVVPVYEGESVWMVKNGKVLQQRIVTGHRTSTQVVVTEGVAVGDTVVLTGFMQLKPNMAVVAKIVE
jgi:membrane fusion protein, multidrug efflux system